jgi:hypothetical protein
MSFKHGHQIGEKAARLALNSSGCIAQIQQKLFVTRHRFRAYHCGLCGRPNHHGTCTDAMVHAFRWGFAWKFAEGQI